MFLAQNRGQTLILDITVVPTPGPLGLLLLNENIISLIKKYNE